MDKTLPKTSLTGFAQYLNAIGILEAEKACDAQEKSLALKTPFITYMAQNNILADNTIAQHASQYFGMPLFNLDAYDTDYIPKELLQTELVQKRFALPLCKRGNSIFLGVADPTIPTLNEINFLTGLNTNIILVESEKLTRTIDAVMNDQLVNALGSVTDADLEAIDITSGDDIDRRDDDDIELNNAPIVRFINKVLLDAVNKGASDIHFEPYEKKYRIRFRQDGILQEVASPPLKMASYLVARLKVMSNLDISERRLPQDGRFKLNLSKHRSIDFRVSTCPTLWGEKVVMRILESSHELLNIDVLGMTEDQRKHFLHNINRSQGMVLVTGPTGSGKTVTLYTALDIINKDGVNISSIEDPIEINLQGINQVQANHKIGLGFTDALRSFLRQDPDVIMVGEIRDKETADIAVKAAQTGHLVFSTLHTNSASETLVRLTNMGVATYNIASSIVLIIAQRLVRRLCPNCKHKIDVPEEALIEEGFDKSEIKDIEIYAAGSCDQCTNGYRGRAGIYEVMPVSEEMGKLVMANANSLQINEQARKENINDLRRSGLDKVKQGVTSLEEINRVIQG